MLNKLPPPTPPYTEGLLTKRFPLLSKEGLGEVVVKQSLYGPPYQLHELSYRFSNANQFFQ